MSRGGSWGKTIRQARLGQPGQGGENEGAISPPPPQLFPSFSPSRSRFSSADFGATCRWNDRERKLRSAAVGDVGNGQARRHRTEFMGAVWVYRVGVCRLSELGGCRSSAVAWSWQGRGTVGGARGNGWVWCKGVGHCGELRSWGFVCGQGVREGCLCVCGLAGRARMLSYVIEACMSR